MELLKSGERVLCWKCKTDQEDPVDDFVVPGRIGETSEQEHECPECGALYTVICTAPGNFEVLAI